MFEKGEEEIWKKKTEGRRKLEKEERKERRKKKAKEERRGTKTQVPLSNSRPTYSRRYFAK